MSEADQRQISRDSLFVMAGLRVAGKEREFRVKIRNLSSGGLMAEGELRVVIGTTVEVEVRNAGWQAGTVVWVQENRFGIAFAQEIDPKLARMPTAAEQQQDEGFYMRKPLASAARGVRHTPSQLRKI